MNALRPAEIMFSEELGNCLSFRFLLAVYGNLVQGWIHKKHGIVFRTKTFNDLTLYFHLA